MKIIGSLRILSFDSGLSDSSSEDSNMTCAMSLEVMSPVKYGFLLDRKCLCDDISDDQGTQECCQTIVSIAIWH